ncbi:MAG TPA: hypothetical protein PKD83_09680 [Ignavibacteria bacterium]|nr:hypothetical protein [Ignavibacteria bacterium]
MNFVLKIKAFALFRSALILLLLSAGCSDKEQMKNEVKDDIQR